MIRRSILALGLLAAARAALAGCLECDAIYATGCNFELWKIDRTTLAATAIGTTPEFMFDIAATSDGRLFALGVSGALWEVDPCTGLTTPAAGAPGGNGLGADLTRAILFGQGPPLTRTDVSTGTTSVIGGSIGPALPDWCGGSTGDLAFEPASGRLFSTLACFGTGCNGDTLVLLDPASGGVDAEVGCTRSAAGLGFPDVHGLAFDSSGALWGALGAVVTPELLQIDPASGTSTPVRVSGGYVCGTGLAILPCARTAPRCEPLTQGFWKRQCAGDHPSGEPRRLPSYVACVAARATFAALTDAGGICDRLVPQPGNDKCEQAEAQLMAAALNFCSGRLAGDCCVDAAPRTVREALEEADALLARPARSFRDCVRAQAIAAGLNEGSSLCPAPLRRIGAAVTLAGAETAPSAGTAGGATGSAVDIADPR